MSRHRAVRIRVRATETGDERLTRRRRTYRRHVLLKLSQVESFLQPPQRASDEAHPLVLVVHGEIHEHTNVLAQTHALTLPHEQGTLQRASSRLRLQPRELVTERPESLFVIVHAGFRGTPRLGENLLDVPVEERPSDVATSRETRHCHSLFPPSRLTLHPEPLLFPPKIKRQPPADFMNPLFRRHLPHTKPGPYVAALTRGG